MLSWLLHHRRILFAFSICGTVIRPAGGRHEWVPIEASVRPHRVFPKERGNSIGLKILNHRWLHELFNVSCSLFYLRLQLCRFPCHLLLPLDMSFNNFFLSRWWFSSISHSLANRNVSLSSLCIETSVTMWAENHTVFIFFINLWLRFFERLIVDVKVRISSWNLNWSILQLPVLVVRWLILLVQTKGLARVIKLGRFFEAVFIFDFFIRIFWRA